MGTKQVVTSLLHAPFTYRRPPSKPKTKSICWLRFPFAHPPSLPTPPSPPARALCLFTPLPFNFSRLPYVYFWHAFYYTSFLSNSWKVGRLHTYLFDEIALCIGPIDSALATGPHRKSPNCSKNKSPDGPTKL